MGHFLDVAGSFIIGGIILLILVTLNLNITASSDENLFTNIAQKDMTTAIEILEHDFYKIGYTIVGEKIAVADSTEIKFYTDIANDNSDDSVHYYLSDVSDLSGTSNPLDRLLIRHKNDESLSAKFLVVDFNLSYYDSIGQQLDYASLTNSSGREKIRSINIAIRLESGEPIDGNYPAAEWKKKITPKNLK
ncbi:MAG TPA: hypothetical protein VI362_03110 [Ignavibacteriaceae bacterium]|nr:hypothetical protein [Ignavibacteriaceae bacterium]